MKRAALALLILCLTASASWGAQSNILFVTAKPHGPQGLALGGFDMGGEFYWMNQIIRSQVEMYGIKYKPVADSSVAGGTRTSFCSSGDMVWGFGTPGSYVEHFDGVLWSQPRAATGLARPDSMLRMAYAPVSGGAGGGPRVPQLFLLSDWTQPLTGSWISIGGDSAAGAKAGTDGLGAVKTLYQVGKPWAFQNGGGYNTCALAASSVGPNGGIRKLIVGNTSSLASYDLGRNSNQPDSMFSRQSPTWTLNDTLAMWDRLYTTGQGVPASFAYIDGAGWLADSNGTFQWATEGDPQMVALAFCHWDSVLNHNLFDWNRLPMVRTITAEGLCSRNLRTAMPGIFNADTGVFYPIVGDSISGIPIVWGVNADLDSMRVYLRDLIVAAKNPSARFTPVIRYDAAAAQNGGASLYHRSRNIWGRARPAYTAYTGTGADTSLYLLLKGAREVLDSVLSANGIRGRLSSICIAPGDQWVPPNFVAGVSGFIKSDSLYYAVVKAGFTELRTDVRDISSLGLSPTTYKGTTTSWGSKARTAPNALVPTQRTVRTTLPSDNVTLKIIGQCAYPQAGSGSQFVLYNGAPYQSWLGLDIGFIWMGFTMGSSGPIQSAGTSATVMPSSVVGRSNRDVFPEEISLAQYAQAIGNGLLRLSDCLVPPQRAYAIRLCAADFSGQANPGGGDSPARIGFWIVKSINGSFQTMSSLNGRTVWRFGYPREVNVDR